MIDLRDFQKWLIKLTKAGTVSIPQHEFFFRTDKEHKEWWRHDVSRLLKYCVTNGILRMGPDLVITLVVINKELLDENKEEEKKSFKTKDPDAYIHQKELDGWLKR